MQLQQLIQIVQDKYHLISLTSNTGGSGYVVGDVLGITTSSVLQGRDATITVTGLMEEALYT